ncbi:MAG: PorT family protein [Muribaculaceae bacterium]|nr:PorT family protein [Muribaculaceae bacterium]
MNRHFQSYHRLLSLLIMMTAAFGVMAQGFNDKVLNRPYADMRRWHLGFSVGVHTQDFIFTHNGYVSDAGEEWYMEQPAFSPGFCVNGLIDYRLNNLFNLRFTPGMYFGNRDVTMREYNTGAELRQNVKAAYVVLPVDLKFSGLRLHNSRPYLTAGIMPAFNVTVKKADYLRTKPMEFYLTAGFGCDFYLPYFKFIPEVKFCFGLTDVIDHDRPDLEDEPDKLKISRSLKKALSRMVVFTFYFE